MEVSLPPLVGWLLFFLRRCRSETMSVGQPLVSVDCYGSVWFGPVRFFWFGSVRVGWVRFGPVRFGSVRFGSVRFGSVWFGARLVRLGSVMFGLIWLV